MKSMAAILLAITTTMISCRHQVNPMKESAGIWISTDFSLDRSSEVLILRDSSITYHPWSPEHYSAPLTQNKGMAFSHGPHGEYESSFTLHGDTLTRRLLHDSTISTFVRAGVDIDTTRLMYCEQLLQIHLPPWPTTNEVSTAHPEPTRLVANIMFGKLKKGEMAERPDIQADSICIQVSDFLIDAGDLPEFARNELSRLSESDGPSLVFVFHADHSTPAPVLEAARQQLVRESNAMVVRAYHDDQAKTIRWGNF